MIESGIQAHAYHQLPGISSSMLSALKRSPAHCWWLHLDPHRPPQADPTPAMTAGTLAHCAILEPESFPARYVVKPDDIDVRTKAGKEWRDAQGAEIITHEQYLAAMTQCGAVLAVPELRHALSQGRPELTVTWTDARTGLECRCRPDWLHTLPDGRAIVLDLKTTGDASPEEFGRSVWKYGYHRQAAHYTAGLQAQGIEVAAFLFAAVTNTYPYIAVPYLLDDEATRKGADEVRELIDLFAECQAAGRWPAYGDGVQILSLPAWAR